MPSASLLRSKLKRLEKEMENFAKDNHFMNLYGSLERKEKDVSEIRGKGYPFFQDELETVLSDLKTRIDTNSEELGRQLISINNNLLGELRQASYFTQISQNDDVSESILKTAERETEDFARKLKSSKERYFSLIDPNFEEKIKRIDELFKRVEYYFKMRDEASFDFNPNEKVVMADKAEWVVTGKGKEDPDGLLFLTDQRILFEQKETTGKFLGVFGGKKQHGLQWEYSIQQIASVSHKDEGMFKGKDMLTLEMGDGAEHSSITLEVKGKDDNSLWAEVLEKAVAGTLE